MTKANIVHLPPSFLISAHHLNSFTFTVNVQMLSILELSFSDFEIIGPAPVLRCSRIHITKKRKILE